MEVNEKIRLVRESNQLSQEDMAEKLSMSLNGYAKIERGVTKLNIQKLEKIAQIFNMDLVELLSINDKGVFYVFGDNSSNHTDTGSNNTTYYGNTQELNSKIEQLELIIKHKEEMLEQKEREIKNLQTIIDTFIAKNINSIK